METEGLLVCGKCRDFLKMHDLIMNKICRTSPKTEVYHVFFWLFLGEVFGDGNTHSFAMSWTFWEAYKLDFFTIWDDVRSQLLPSVCFEMVT